MNDLSIKAQKTVESLSSELKELALNIWNNPEIGLEEHTACRLQIELLKKYGFETESPFAGFETAYRAVYRGKKPGPKIAMLAEYDALPEIGHGCGHNLIAMVGVGSGIAMRELADELGGEIYVFGTPAEENLGSKVQMSEQGAFDAMDVAMMSHPASYNADCFNTTAVNSYQISFYGKPAHAAGAPYEGRNALDAMINFFNMVNALRQQTKPDVRIHGIITKGGAAPNIIPDYTESIFYLRANHYRDLDDLFTRVENCAKGAALGAGVECRTGFTQGNNKDTCSNLALADLIARQMERLGVTVTRTNGEYTPGSSDMGDVSYCCPAVQSTFDISGGKNINPHTREFTQCAGSQGGMDAALKVICGFYLTAAELMSNPDCLQTIRDEFDRMQK